MHTTIRPLLDFRKRSINGILKTVFKRLYYPLERWTSRAVIWSESSAISHGSIRRPLPSSGGACHSHHLSASQTC